MKAMDLFRLDGKVALVSGGAGIYGTHISDALAEAGATVIIAARTLEKCEAKAQELRQAGYEADATRLDLSEEQSVLGLKDFIWDKYGKLDVLFNNSVARVPDCPPFENMTVQQWEDVMRVNSTGVFLACRTLGSAMVEQGWGSIVNIASIYGVVGPDFGIYGDTGMVNPADYSFSKGGMVNFTRYLATYFAPKVRVNSISPGGYGTSDHQSEFAKNYCARTPLGRLAGPDDIKGPAVFLASEASQYVTGVNLMVDGGWTAW